MFPGITIETFSRQCVQSFINQRMITQHKAKRTVYKQVCGIRSYWNYPVSLDEPLRDRRPLTHLAHAQVPRRKPTDPDFQIQDDDGPRFDTTLVPRPLGGGSPPKQLDLRDVVIIATFTEDGGKP